MNNLTVIGQYVPTNSIIHRLDSRTKILSMLILVVAAFIIPMNASIGSLIAMGAMVLLPLVIVVIARIPILRVIAGLKPVIILLLMTFIIQLFIIQEGEQLFSATMYLSWSAILVIVGLIALYFVVRKFVKLRITLIIILVALVFVAMYFMSYLPLWDFNFVIYSGGLIRSGFIAARLISVMMIASLLTFTTSTIQLNDGIESLLSPLKIIKINPAVGAMVMSLALRFIPTLLSETQKIMKAQASRGVDFNESKLRQKILQVVSLLIPIFNISYRRALELADAMEVRGYIVGGKRTKIDNYKIVLKDWVALIFSLLVLGVIIYVRIVAL